MNGYNMKVTSTKMNTGLIIKRNCIEILEIIMFRQAILRMQVSHWPPDERLGARNLF